MSVLFFFFKQKTAYEMRISDWSSDVCSSDLAGMKTLADAARDKRAAADLAARETFDGLSIPGVGGETWRALWEAARRYSEQTAYPGAPFPPTGDEACVLCQDRKSTRLNSSH